MRRDRLADQRMSKTEQEEIRAFMNEAVQEASATPVTLDRVLEEVGKKNIGSRKIMFSNESIAWLNTRVNEETVEGRRNSSGDLRSRKKSREPDQKTQIRRCTKLHPDEVVLQSTQR